MKDSLRTLKGWFVGCALLALAGCGGGGAAPSTAIGSGSDATSSQEALHSHGHGPRVTPQTSGTSNLLIAVSAVNDRVVWAAGIGGTFAVTTNGGATWRTGVVPGSENQQFRDVEAVSEKVAYLLQVPDTDFARVFKTTDGGKTWTSQLQGGDLTEFFDCFAFWDSKSAVMMVDSINGRLPIRRTLDGQTWQDIGDRLPPALPFESAFASSGTCAATQGHRRAWITTAAPPPEAPDGTWTTRVFRTTDRGQSWAVSTAPLTAPGASFGGGASIAFRDARHGILGGGDFLGTEVIPNFARSSDGGKTWSLGTAAPITGAIFGLAYAGHGKGHDDDDGEHGHARDDEHGASIRVVATGDRGGAAWSGDEGRTWTSLSGLSGLWGVDFGDGKTGWLVGRNGQIVRIDF